MVICKSKKIVKVTLEVIIKKIQNMLIKFFFLCSDIANKLENLKLAKQHISWEKKLLHKKTALKFRK